MSTVLQSSTNLPADLFRAPPHKLANRVHHIGHIDVGPIRARLATKTAAEWLENSLRQKQFAVHKDTQSLVLKWCENTSTDTPVDTSRHYADFEDLLAPILAQIQSDYGYEKPVIRKAMFARLRAGGEIICHVDATPALRMVHRIHIPIVTNPGVHFYIDDIDHHFPEGAIIEFDNTRYHAVKNNGQEDRIHLIIDYYHA